MKSNRILGILLAAALLGSSATSLIAEDWKTTDGKVYQNVTVIDSKPDSVTILHQDGGALVSLANLPADIQKRFNYDPVKAKAAADARSQKDAENARALQAEMQQTASETQDTSAPDANPSPANNEEAASTTPVSSNGAHYSTNDLTASTSSLRRDLSDPTYHTMAHLSASIHSLGRDPSDSTHHSISEIADSDL